MKKWIWITVLAIFMAAHVQAKEPPEAILQSLPDRVKTFIASDTVSYDEPGLGASRGYNDPDGIVITLYLYDLGVLNVEDGVTSEIILAAKEHAIEDIRQAESMGYYNRVQIISDRQILFDPGDGRSLKMLSTKLSYIMKNPVTAEQHQVASDLYLTGLRGYICKIRVSRAAAREKEWENRIEDALYTLLSILRR